MEDLSGNLSYHSLNANKMFASSGSSVKFWHTENYNLIQELQNSSSDISVISWNKDGQFLSALDPNTSEVALYTVNTMSAVCSGILRIMENINCLQFCNTNNRYLAVGGARDSVLLWDVKGNYKKKSFVVTKAGVTKLSFSPTDSHLAIGTVQGDAFLVSNTNNLISGPVKLFSEKTKVKDIRYSVLNRSLVGACGENGSVIFMDTNASKVLKEFPHVHSAPASNVAFSPINELLMVSVGYDKKFVSYNANTKGIIMKFEAASPLTCVCFMSNGQSVAVGTMTGEVVVFDLRMFNSPLATVLAHKGPVHDLKLQPRINTENVKLSKSATKNAVGVAKKVGQKSQDNNSRSVSKTEQVTSSNVAASLTPTLDIISPLQFQLNRDENFCSENTPLLKNMKTPARSFKKHTNEFDDFGILSPLDKENKSPVRLPSGTDKRITMKPTFMDGLLSPVKASPTTNNSSKAKSPFNRSIPKNEIIKSAEKLHEEKAVVPEFIDELLSPLKYDSDKERSCMKETSEILNNFDQLLSPEAQSYSNSAEILLPSASVENVTKVLLNTEISASADCKQTRNPESEIRPRSRADDDGSDSLETSLILPSCVGEISLNMLSSVNNINNSNNTSNSNTSKSKVLGKETIINTSDGESKVQTRVNDLDQRSEEEEAFQIAFPADGISAGEGYRPEMPLVSPKLLENRSATNINLELIQNCVADALERHEFEVNKRFMHMHYTMVKHILNLKKEIQKTVQELSINEELLQENEKLRDEINKLKCLY